MFVKNAWYVAATVEEIDQGLVGRTLLDEPVILFRAANGRAAALEDRCCHRNAPLSIGRLIDGHVECGYHGFRFDGDGKCVEVPSQDDVPDDASVRTYPVVERDKWVWIWMGDPARADADTIPDMFWHDDPGWVPIFGQFHVGCHYQALLDIQLDQTHSPFVHPDSLGTKAKLKVPPKVTRDGETLRCERVYKNADAPELWAKAGNITGPADGWTRWHYLPPSAVVFDIGWQAVDACATSIALRVHNSHAITPETERTAHHFWANARNFNLDDEETTRKLSGIRKTFSEDIGVVEATQRNVDRFGDPPIVHVQSDAPTIQARRLVARLLEAEQRSSAA